MTTSPPSKLWADGPCPLIQTPQYKTKKTDVFTTGATHMAHIHNAILRGYNSIYRQAPYITHEDKNDFIGYTQSWFKFVKSHHDDEEAELFPKVEEVMGRTDLWTETHKEHESFLAGLSEFNTYLNTLGEPYDFDAKKLLSIMDGFQEPFNWHFHHEIETIASFAGFPEAKKAEQAAAIFKAWGKKTVTKAGTTDVVPFFLLNLDTTFEDGMWASWPPMPAPIRWGLVILLVRITGVGGSLRVAIQQASQGSFMLCSNRRDPLRAPSPDCRNLSINPGGVSVAAYIGRVLLISGDNFFLAAIIQLQTRTVFHL